DTPHLHEWEIKGGSTRRLLPARRPVSGACPDIRPCNRPCATRISTASVFPASTFLPTLNPIEPPWYGPVCPVVWEGWRREASPYPDQSANIRLATRRNPSKIINEPSPRPRVATIADCQPLPDGALTPKRISLQ